MSNLISDADTKLMKEKNAIFDTSDDGDETPYPGVARTKNLKKYKGNKCENRKSRGFLQANCAKLKQSRQ